MLLIEYFYSVKKLAALIILFVCHLWYLCCRVWFNFIEVIIPPSILEYGE